MVGAASILAIRRIGWFWGFRNGGPSPTIGCRGRGPPLFLLCVINLDWYGSDRLPGETPDHFPESGDIHAVIA